MTGTVHPPDPRNPYADAATTSIETAGVWCLRLADGPLSVAEGAALQAWLAADPQHRVQFDAARSAWNATGHVGAHPWLQQLHRNALAQVQVQQRLRRFALIAAAACVLFALGAIWWQWAPRTYQTGVGERKQVTLTDGSIMQLDAMTQVEVRIGRERRELELQHGRAIFQVANDPARRFTVAAAGSTIIATGTRFSVERLPQQLRVVLYEGRVAVLDGDAESSTPDASKPDSSKTDSSTPDSDRRRVLAPAQELIAEPGKIRSAAIAQVDLNATEAWQRGLLVLRNEPLELAVTRVNRYAPHALRVGDSIAAQTRISGVFKAGDTAAFVSGVTASFALRARRARGATILESQPRASIATSNGYPGVR